MADDEESGGRQNGSAIPPPPRPPSGHGHNNNYNNNNQALLRQQAPPQQPFHQQQQQHPHHQPSLPQNRYVGSQPNHLPHRLSNISNNHPPAAALLDSSSSIRMIANEHSVENDNDNNNNNHQHIHNNTSSGWSEVTVMAGQPPSARSLHSAAVIHGTYRQFSYKIQTNKRAHFFFPSQISQFMIIFFSLPIPFPIF
jgi:hypothetical protein